MLLLLFPHYTDFSSQVAPLFLLHFLSDASVRSLIGGSLHVVGCRWSVFLRVCVERALHHLLIELRYNLISKS